MTKEEKKKKIIEICKFLKKNNALEKYCMNVLSFHSGELKITKSLPLKKRVECIVTTMFDKVRENDYPRLYDFFQSCDTCFFWSETPEGNGFWAQLHSQWTEIVTGENY